MKTVLFVDRTALGRWVLQRRGDTAVPDYRKLRHHFAADCCVAWGLAMPRDVAAIIRRRGTWEVRNLPALARGLIEADMAKVAMNLDAECRRFVFVSGSAEIVPLVRVLAAEGHSVVVAAYSVHPDHLPLVGFPGVEYVDLNEIPDSALLRPKRGNANA